MRALLAIAVLLLALGCGGDDPTGGGFPDATGRYEGDWQLVETSADGTSSSTCSGYVLIATQSGAEISGEAEACEGPAKLFTGIITRSGDVTTTLVPLGPDQTTCKGDRRAKGTLDGDLLLLATEHLVCGAVTTAEMTFTGAL